MPDLSPAYKEVKQLRSHGKCAPAVAVLRSKPPASDEDAFEAVVCLFVCGDLPSALNVCRTYAWKKEWAREISAALSERFAGGSAPRALWMAKKALAAPGAPYDATAMYLLLLQESGRIEEASAYVKSRLQTPPAGETFLLTVMADIALTMKDWRDAYRAASAVLSENPDDHRALLALSMANYGIGNIHESLGNARRASFVDPSPPAILQIMRCQNKLGDYYAALAAFDRLREPGSVAAEFHVELGDAYAGLEDQARAIAEYREALATGSRSIAALRALVGIYTRSRLAADLEGLIEAYSSEIKGDIDCLYLLGLAALDRRDLDEAQRLFSKTLALAEETGDALDDLPWPVPEPRLRHDYEQLELLERRGRLEPAGRDALNVLKRYYDPGRDRQAAFAPAGPEAEVLKRLLCTTFQVPDPPFGGCALGENDYRAIEEQYLAERLVVIDGFLSPEALAAFRRFCEEATVWKIDNPRGYLGAILAQGFSPRVLLAISDELKQAMPRVIGDQPLLQSWAFKYDQRMQGINMHADFARVNVNFWITPDDACTDLTTGGLVVYDVPVPGSWTFADYNTDSEKLAAYVKVHNATPRRVPYRANRCVLFDSSLIHISDEMHFKPGYENRRVNVTLLYGKARSVE